MSHINHYSSPICVQAQGSGLTSCPPQNPPQLSGPGQGPCTKSSGQWPESTLTFSESPRPVPISHRLVRGEPASPGQVSPWREPHSPTLWGPLCPFIHPCVSGKFGRGEGPAWSLPAHRTLWSVLCQRHVLGKVQLLGVGSRGPAVLQLCLPLGWRTGQNPSLVSQSALLVMTVISICLSPVSFILS